MLPSNYLLFKNIKFCITETNFRMTSQLGYYLEQKRKSQCNSLNYFQSRNKPKALPLIILGNPPILMKCSLIDICIIILFQKKSNFTVELHFKHSIKHYFND